MVAKTDRWGTSIGSTYSTSLEASAIIERGLPFAAIARLQRSSGLSLDRIKASARISEGSFARRKRSGQLSLDESERLLRIARVFEKTAALHNGDTAAASNWLETPLPVLNGRSPLDLARTEPGAREVEDLVGRIEHGIVS